MLLTQTRKRLLVTDVSVSVRSSVPVLDEASKGVSLFDEPLLYHEISDRAYFGALVQGDGKMLHECHPVECLPDWLRSIDRTRDSFVSQGQFWRAQRRIAALRSMGLLWCDLGDDGELGRYGDSWAVQRILEVADEECIPPPSLIVASGRGYHAKWFFTRAVPWQALDRWNIVERTISERLQEPLNADLRAVDAARVLRVVGTMNSRSGTIARSVWCNNVDDEPLRYGFDELAYEILNLLRPSYHTRREEPRRDKKKACTGQTGGGAHYTIGSLWWSRLRDIRRLCELRGWTAPYGGVPVGYRDMVLFLGSVALSWIARPGTWWQEVESLSVEFTPSLRRREWQTYVGTAYRRLLASVGPDRIEHRYRYSTARIVQDLDISRLEMAKLEVLVHPDITHARKLVRDRERIAELRRASGVVEREAYLATAQERAQEARKLADEGLELREIAERLEVDLRTVQRYLSCA